MNNNNNDNLPLLNYNPTKDCIVKTIHRKDLIKVLQSFNTNSIKVAVFKDYPLIHIWNDDLHVDFLCQQ